MAEQRNLPDDQRNHIEEVGNLLLGTLAEVAQWADAQLEREQTVDGLNETARLSISASLAEIRQGVELLRREPAIARVVVHWQPVHCSNEFLVCRGAAAGAPTVNGLAVASYRSPVGRLVEHEPGGMVTIRIGGKERTGKIIEREKWSTSHSEDLWDARDCAFDLEAWQRIITSVRRFVEDVQRFRPTTAPLDAIYAAAEEAENILYERSRRAIDRIALRDQPILDRHQGEVFRMPLNRRVLLIGPPGTGKTTTLIKRIAQKQTLSELPEQEVSHVKAAGLGERFSIQDGWVMFAPTELLTLYLQDAFNREGVPASGQLKAWDRERRRLAREVVPILKTESRGRFREDSTRPILQTLKSPSISALYDTLAEFHLARVIRNCRDAIDNIAKSEEEVSQELSTLLQARLRLQSGSSPQVLQRLCPPPDLLRTVAERMQAQTKDWTDQEANRILRVRPGILDQLHPFLDGNPLQQGTDEDGEADDESQVNRPSPSDSPAMSRKRAADLLVRTLRTCATSAARGESPRRHLRKEIGAVLEALLPPPETASQTGRRILLRRSLMVLINAPRRWVFDVAVSYSRFRREHPELYLADIGDSDDSISGDEVDVLILLSLRNAKTLQTGQIGSSPLSWLSRIRQSYYPQIYIDEATDFSAVQLAALMELSHPGLRSWFACGDFRQRITLNGIASQPELRWIEKTGGVDSEIDLKRVDIPYRQSERLRELSEAIDPDLSILQDAPESAYQNDPAPLLLEAADQACVSSWIAKRVVEIETSLGRLPSIAVFVNGDDKIGPAVDAAVEPLREHSIEIVGCPEGRIFGHAEEVRVFDVRHIKGLEFEAVFFIDLDDLEKAQPELFHRFLYVGATRAATYLGISCRTKLPNRLLPVRRLFSDGGWGPGREHIGDRPQEEPRSPVMTHFQASVDRNRRLGEMLAR